MAKVSSPFARLTLLSPPTSLTRVSCTTPFTMSHYATLICILLLLLPAGHCNPVLHHYTDAQTTCPWLWWKEAPIPCPTSTDGVYWIIKLPSGRSVTTCTGFMTSYIPETKKTPYTIHKEWFLIAAEIWTVVELTVPPPTQDAGDNTKAKTVKPAETEAVHITSTVKEASSEEAKSEKNKENCPVTSVEATSRCE